MNKKEVIFVLSCSPCAKVLFLQLWPSAWGLGALAHYARSVSESALPRLIDYIQFQEFHHRGKSWEDELKEIFGDPVLMKS